MTDKPDNPFRVLYPSMMPKPKPPASAGPLAQRDPKSWWAAQKVANANRRPGARNR
jgi:hypothetical protein